jgi:hypothetical protein
MAKWKGTKNMYGNTQEIAQRAVALAVIYTPGPFAFSGDGELLFGGHILEPNLRDAIHRTVLILILEKIKVQADVWINELEAKVEGVI